MGNMRLFHTWTSLIFGLVLAVACTHVEAQLTHSFGDKATHQSQQAYYQPQQSRSQYRQQQATYAQEVSVLGQNGFAQDQQRRSIQQRASDLLRSGSLQVNEPATSQFQTSFPQRRRGSNVGYRRLQDQDDPFGEGQAQPSNQPTGSQQQPSNQFNPFADPPAQDNPPAMQRPANIDPFADPQPREPQRNPEPQSPFGQTPETTPREPFQQPTQMEPTPPQMDQELTNPFADPPKEQTEPRMQAPESTPRQPSDVDYPPESVTPDDVPSNDNSQPQQQSVDALDYEQGRPFQESINRSNVYRAPPVDAMPPIVQPNQAPAYNLQPQMQQRMTQPRMAPTYQSPYQPIPGLAPSQPLYQQPGYQQPAYQPPAYQQQVPSQPMYSQQAPSAFAQNNVAGDPSVYSPVVGQCGSCNSCNNGCKSCGEGCPNFYVSLFAGISDLRDLESQAGFGSINADSGEAFGIALGRRNGRNLRTEAEFTYRQNDIDGMLPTLQPFSGSLNSYSGMANAYWEFIDVPTGCFKPYIGVGIGFVGVDVEATDQLGRNLIPSSTDNDTSFAFQYMAGVNYKAYRNVDLFAEYRFFEADSFRINAPGLADSFNYETDNVLFGFRWKF